MLYQLYYFKDIQKHILQIIVGKPGIGYHITVFR